MTRRPTCTNCPTPAAGAEANTSQRRRRSLIVALLLAFLAIASAVATWVASRNMGYARNGLQPPEMAAAQFSPQDVVGDLGGMPVTIPKHFANYVEYDGDPGFGEKRRGPRPERTHQSKLMSFGYDVRFPDMAGMSSSETWKDRQRYSIYNTPWISVGVGTGEIYPGDGFLDRRAAARSRPSGLSYEAYAELPGTEYGLTVHAPSGTDPKTGRLYREHPNARDVFVHRGKDSKVDAYIACSNVSHEAAPCQHSFSLEPAVRAKISVIYRRGYLPQWREIQTAVTRQILSFKTKDANPPMVNR